MPERKPSVRQQQEPQRKRDGRVRQRKRQSGRRSRLRQRRNSPKHPVRPPVLRRQITQAGGGNYAPAGSVSNGQAVVNYGMQFLGNPYVFGGTSLTNGADCSGFVQSVYAAFGVKLPRNSTAQRSAGYGVASRRSAGRSCLLQRTHRNLRG